MVFEQFDFYWFTVHMVTVILAITIHEFAHAYSAYRAGDDTPRLQGRISLNPIDHLDPMGTMMMVVSSLSGYGIGWGKPVQVNPYNLRHPRWDNLKVSLWGPLSNIITATIFGLAIRFFGHAMSQSALALVAAFVLTNLGLAIFNLLPIAPLDGSHILIALLPDEQARKYDMFMARFGMWVFLVMIISASGATGVSVLGRVIGPPMRLMWTTITGLPL